MKKIDTRGKLCPLPLIMLKKTIDEAKQGEPMEVLTDNETALSNLKRFLKELKCQFTEETQNGVFVLRFIAPGKVVLSKEPEAYCETASKKSGNVIVFNSRFMGKDNQELGAILIRSFINALPELDELPQKIVMYNEGVFLAKKDTDTADSLIRLQEKGVEVIVCGTCVDYFDLKKDLAVGTISNMYSIIKVLSEANHIINP